MISLIIAGGISMAANPKSVNWPDIDNHTLKGEAIVSSKVVCRTMWGTPMLPDGKGGYSLIAAINEDYIKESLIQPPQYTRGMVAYRPLPAIEIEEVPTLPAPATVAPAAATPAASQAAPASAAPVEAPLPDASAPADAPAAQ
jgi:hypothetical protein